MTNDPDYEVIVIGAGVAGIYQIKLLKDLGYEMATRRKWLKDHPTEVVEGALSGLA